MGIRLWFGGIRLGICRLEDCNRLERLGWNSSQLEWMGDLMSGGINSKVW